MSNTQDGQNGSNGNGAQHDHNAVDELRDRVEKGWDTFKNRAQATFEKLTHEDLDSIKGKLDQLVHRIKDRYGYDEAKAREEISRFVSEGGSTGSTDNAAASAGDDHRDPSGPGDPPNPTHVSASPNPQPGSKGHESRSAR